MPAFVNSAVHLGIRLKGFEKNTFTTVTREPALATTSKLPCSLEDCAARLVVNRQKKISLLTLTAFLPKLIDPKTKLHSAPAIGENRTERFVLVFPAAACCRDDGKIRARRSTERTVCRSIFRTAIFYVSFTAMSQAESVNSRCNSCECESCKYRVPLHRPDGMLEKVERASLSPASHQEDYC
jgi:hypothetical protein